MTADRLSAAIAHLKSTEVVDPQYCSEFGVELRVQTKTKKTSVFLSSQTVKREIGEGQIIYERYARSSNERECVRVDNHLWTIVEDLRREWAQYQE